MCYWLQKSSPFFPHFLFHFLRCCSNSIRMGIFFYFRLALVYAMSKGRVSMATHVTTAHPFFGKTLGNRIWFSKFCVRWWILNACFDCSRKENSQWQIFGSSAMVYAPTIWSNPLWWLKIKFLHFGSSRVQIRWYCNACVTMHEIESISKSVDIRFWGQQSAWCFAGSHHILWRTIC